MEIRLIDDLGLIYILKNFIDIVDDIIPIYGI